MTALRTLKRKKAHREWLLRNLTNSVILYEHIETTQAKAKDVRRWVDRLINMGKKDSLANRRRLLAFFPDRNAAKKIWEVLAQRYADRTSGFTRPTLLGQRLGDGALLVRLELVSPKAALKPKPTEETAAKPNKRSIKPSKTRVTIRKKKAAA